MLDIAVLVNKSGTGVATIKLAIVVVSSISGMFSSSYSTNLAQVG